MEFRVQKCCCMCSGKRFSKLMRKHKGLLRVDLRSNAEGLSGVLQMMPKDSAHSALKPDPSQVSDHASMALLGEAQATAIFQQGQDRGHSQHQQGLLTGGGIQGEHGSQHQLQSEGASRSMGCETSQKSTFAASSRKSLVPKFTADSQHVRQQADKENSSFDGARGVSKQSSRAAKPKASARPVSAKPKAAVAAKAVRRPSTAQPAAQSVDFDSTSRLQSQPTANMSQFAAARPGVLEDGDFATASFSAGYLVDPLVHNAHQFPDNAAVGASVSFNEWADPASHHHHHAQIGSLYAEHMLASDQFERESTACPAHRMLSFQEHQTRLAADQDMHQQQAAAARADGAAADMAADSTYLRDVSAAFREVQVAEEEGRSRAAADHALWSQAAAGYETEYVPDELLPRRSAVSVRDPSSGMTGPNSEPVKTQQVMSSQQAQQQARAGPKAIPRQALAADQAMLRSYGHPDVADRSGATLQIARRAADPEDDAESRMPDQALSVAEAAMEAAKLNVWKAEVMCEIKGLKSSLEGQAAERQRAEAWVAELQETLKLASRKPLPDDPFKPAVARQKPITASSNKSSGLAKKPTASKQKRKPKGAGADLLQDDLSGEVLRGQQQIMGNLSQVIRSLDELVSDIEDTQAHPTDDQSHMHEVSHGGTQIVAGQNANATTQSHSCINDVLEDVARQLSMKFDLHDTWCGV
ncbi:TPA: hypothetical protein ACH3X1_000537 [Trebouxia sp. C0004]